MAKPSSAKSLIRRVKRRLTVAVDRRLPPCIAPPEGWFRRRPAELPPGSLDCMIAANEHGTYCLPRSSAHRPVPRTILRGNVWERETLDLLRATPPTGDIVHAGTYFGDFLPALSRSREGDGTIWAFEPNLESYRCAQVTILLNGLANCSLTRAGLGGDPGVAILETADRHGTSLGGGSSLVEHVTEMRPAGHERVEVVAIDDALPGNRQVSAMHLDVEGNEQSALGGAMGTIRRCRPLLILETVPESTWVAEQLGPLGYFADGHIDGNAVLRAGPPPSGSGGSEGR